MLKLRCAAVTFSVIAAVASASGAAGQNYPSRPLRIVTSGIGSGADFVARMLAQGLTGSLGEQAVVDNRATGVAPGELVARAAPDGYTLLFYGTTVWLLPFMRDNVPYDPVKDFAPISMTNRSPNVLVVHPSLPLKSVGDLIALAKSQPGALNYATTGSGNATHLAGELFKAMAGVNIVRINYKATGPALNDLIGGQLQLMFATAASVTQHTQSGRLRALASTSAQPSSLLPGLPTVASAGLPGYELVAINGMFAPARTPAAIVNRLNSEIVQFLAKPDVKERFLKAGVETVGSSPREFAATIKSEMARLGKLIRDVGIRDE